MIKLRNIEKFYNRKKENEIHVINNTTLEFPDTGLVALLGKSGSGKTTLLNVIGGLDSFDSGAVQIDDIILDRFDPKVWDAMRSKKIGYIFQNYYLLNDKTVYENLEISLKLAGLADKEETEKRIDYALSLVGLQKFRRRTPNTLSGGQQQRVGIARALVKGPSIIIADEPTGNLDSDNTFEVMDLLKSISKTCLVILVTHEENIAEFFADRIIRLKDGKIIEDYVNESVSNLSVADNKKIFLKDLKYSEVLKAENVTINYNGDRKSDFVINIIEKDGRLYIDSFNSSMPVSLIDDKSEVRVVDAHFEEKKKGEHKSVTVDGNILSEVKGDNSKGIIDTVSVFKKAVKDYFRKPFKNKAISHLILFLTAAIITVLANFLSMFMFFNEDNYLENRNLIRIDSMGIYETSDLLALEDTNGIDKILLSGSVRLSPLKNYETSYGDELDDYISYVNIFPVEELINPKIILGNLPSGSDEAVIDIKVFKAGKNNLNSSGVKEDDYAFLIGEKVASNNYEFTITGIVDSGYLGAFIEEDTLNEVLGQDPDIWGLPVLCSDKNAFKEWADKNAFLYYDDYTETINIFKQARNGLMTSLIIVMIIGAGFIFMISSHNVKNSFINNIKTIGTYRCIGVKKSELMKEFIFENLMTLTFSALIGIIFSGLVLSLIKPLLEFIGYTFNAGFLLYVIVFIIIYGANIGFTSLRVSMLLRKTPAEIMAKYDI